MNDLNLRRFDYIQAESTSPKTTQLIPSATGKGQKIVNGDSSGTLQCFTFRKDQVQNVFKDSSSSNIKRVILGKHATSSKNHRIFVASGVGVKGFTQKGKKFLTLATDMLEPLQAISVLDDHLVVCSKFNMSHYKDCRHIHHFSCGEKVNDVLCLPTEGGGDVMSILACQDRMFRVFQESKLLYEAETPGKPLVLEPFGRTGGADGHQVIYGTSDGRIGKTHLGSCKPTPTWEVYNHKRRAGVLALDSFDITGDGVLDLLVGRDDGQIEVYAFEDADDPSLKYNHTGSESLTSVKGGNVAFRNFDEIVCTSYSGCVYSLNKKPAGAAVNQGFSQEGVFVMKKLKSEIEELQQKLTEEKEKYVEAMDADNAISGLPLFPLKESFDLDVDDASYSLSLELESAIESLVLQSNVPVDVMDSCTSAIVSFSPCKFEDGNLLLATFRCQANTMRIDLKVRTIEGHSGVLQAYITPKIRPKMCRLLQLPIKPLSLHGRCHVMDESRPMTLLKLSGPFSVSDIHSWLSACLPEMPERPPMEDSCRLQFYSVMLGTRLNCQYKKGQAQFGSDNVSTICILKEHLTSQAHKARVKMDLHCELNEDSVPHSLQLIYPLLDKQQILAKKVQLIDALLELQSCEDDLTFLADEYKAILEGREKLLEEFKSQPCRLERLYGLITDLYIDAFKLRGQNVKGKTQELLKVLEKGDLDALLLFFQPS